MLLYYLLLFNTFHVLFEDGEKFHEPICQCRNIECSFYFSNHGKHPHKSLEFTDSYWLLLDQYAWVKKNGLSNCPISPLKKFPQCYMQKLVKQKFYVYNQIGFIVIWIMNIHNKYYYMMMTILECGTTKTHMWELDRTKFQPSRKMEKAYQEMTTKKDFTGSLHSFLADKKD